MKTALNAIDHTNWSIIEQLFEHSETHLLQNNFTFFERKLIDWFIYKEHTRTEEHLNAQAYINLKKNKEPHLVDLVLVGLHVVPTVPKTCFVFFDFFFGLFLIPPVGFLKYWKLKMKKKHCGKTFFFKRWNARCIFYS